MGSFFYGKMGERAKNFCENTSIFCLWYVLGVGTKKEFSGTDQKNEKDAEKFRERAGKLNLFYPNNVGNEMVLLGTNWTY